MQTLNICELQRLADDEVGGWRNLSPTSIVLIGAAMEYLSDVFRYSCDGDLEITVGTKDYMDEIVARLGAEMSITMIGQVVMVATQYNPDWTLPCDGGLYSRVAYPELYAVIDPEFIVDADYFHTPNLNGKVPIGQDLNESVPQYPNLGEVVGNTNHMLGYTEMFPHNHQYVMPIPAPALEGAGVPLPTGLSTITSFTGVTPDAGTQTAFSLIQPSTVVRFIIVAK